MIGSPEVNWELRFHFFSLTESQWDLLPQLLLKTRLPCGHIWKFSPKLKHLRIPHSDLCTLPCTPRAFSQIPVQPIPCLDSEATWLQCTSTSPGRKILGSNRLFNQANNSIKRTTGWKLNHAKCHLEIRHKFLIVRAINHWNRLLGECWILSPCCLEIKIGCFGQTQVIGLTTE